MSGRRYRDFAYYSSLPRSTPRQAKGGMKAQSKRGAFGERWWAKHWIATRESFQIGTPVGRAVPDGQRVGQV